MIGDGKIPVLVVDPVFHPATWVFEGAAITIQYDVEVPGCYECPIFPEGDGHRIRVDTPVPAAGDINVD